MVLADAKMAIPVIVAKPLQKGMTSVQNSDVPKMELVILSPKFAIANQGTPAEDVS